MRSEVDHGSQEFSDLGSQISGCQDVGISGSRVLGVLGLMWPDVVALALFARRAMFILNTGAMQGADAHKV